MKSFSDQLDLVHATRVAVIDLGTNTFNLLIADVFSDRFDLIHTEKEGVALGMGGINDGLIAPDAFERGISAMVRFKQICQSFEVEEIIAIGTSALRDASNSEDFQNRVYMQTKILIQIISGEEEAEMIYKGVLWSYDFSERAVIMDIGGGSTEFIFANAIGIEQKISLNIGVSRIFQELKLNDPLTAGDVDLIEKWLDVHSDGFFDDKQCDVLLGASGSFETFHEMIHRERFPNVSKAIEIPIQQIVHILDWTIYSNQYERDHHPFIIPIRKKMAPIAAVKTRWVMNKLLVKKVFVTPFSLKEGALEIIQKG